MLQETTHSRRIKIILAGAAAEFNMTVERMDSKRRSSRESTARMLAMTALCEFTSLSWRDIARAVNREQAKSIKPDIRRYLWISNALERIAARLREAGLEPKLVPPTRPKLRARETGPFVGPILAAVCEHFDISLELLSSPRKLQHLTPARVAAIHALRKFTTLSTPAIGDILDRDHSTIVYHLKHGPKYPWLPATLRDIEAQLAAAVSAQAAA